MLTLYKLLKFIFRHLIPRSWRYPLVRWIAKGIILFNKPRREIIVGNLTPLVGETQARKLASVMLGNFLMTAVDFFCAREGLARDTPTVDWQYIEKTYRKTKRLICVTAHLGHWELGISCLVEKRYSVAGVYAPYRADEIVRWIMGHRNSDVEWIPAMRGAADACIAALQRGRIVGMVADIPFGEKGRRVKIAGHYAHMPLGPWGIAVRAKAAVVPAFIVRDKPGQYRLITHEPIVAPEGVSFRKQMETMQDVYVAHLERYLQTYPTQWGVLQPFWARQRTEEKRPS
jgi:Kdo2-lipid IVA lauroyltransferase/acyltransferase